MKRRWLLAVMGLAAASVAKAAERTSPMKVVQLGPWEFSVPEDWAAKENDGQNYLESRDGAVGCYVKAVELAVAMETAEAVAKSVQGIHESAFRKATKENWRIVARTGMLSGALFRSHLDMFDAESKYRVLSLVLASTADACQVTIHNYDCGDYLANRDAYRSTEQSMRRAR